MSYDPMSEQSGEDDSRPLPEQQEQADGPEPTDVRGSAPDFTETPQKKPAKIPYGRWAKLGKLGVKALGDDRSVYHPRKAPHD